jgi:VCBS repeat protein
VAVDVDGDGDLDIVAGALLAGGSDVDEATLPALVWLERTGRDTFVKHTIEMGFPRHATLDAADIDGDGDIDIVAGDFAANRSVPAWVEVWENQSRHQAR